MQVFLKPLTSLNHSDVPMMTQPTFKKSIHKHSAPAKEKQGVPR